MLLKLFIILLPLFCSVNCAVVENDTILEELDPDQAYCLRFTWLGPEYDKDSNFNTTCDELLGEKRAINTPCRHPLVVSENGTEPDLNYIWENHKNRVACRKAKGQVCAKFSYFFNNAVMNVTYMCTRVSARDEGVVTSGCYSQTNSGYKTEVCVCDSSKGTYKPCNGSSNLQIANLSLFLVVSFAITRFLQQIKL